MTKYLITLLILTGSIATSFAQVPDSVVYKKNKVKEVNSWMHIVGFKASNDTCLFGTKKIDRNGQTTYAKVNYNCQGWDALNEIVYTYDSNHRVVEVETMFNEQMSSKISKKLDEYGRPIEENNVFFEPYTEIHMENTYYGNSALPDSMHSVEINNGDTTRTLTIYTYMKGKLKQSKTIDVDNNKPVNTQTNKYDSRGRLIRSEFIYFLGYDNDVITEFEYNEKNQISGTSSEIDETSAKFYYDSKTGLLLMTQYYNRFGSLEKEIFHKYEYYE